MTKKPPRTSGAGAVYHEPKWEDGVNEVRVARYRDLIESGRYYRSSRQLADRILEQDLEMFTPAPPWLS